MEWIRTDRQLPEKDTEVLIIVKGKYITVGELTNYDKWMALNGLGIVEATGYFSLNQVTHWMPYPELPI